MKSVTELFEMISKIPRCSFETSKMRDFLILFAKRYGFNVETDNAGNVLCKKGIPRICLQSHYDMVCLGSAPEIELYKEGNLLKAKNSTLGADNGIGVAIMLYCMQKYDNLELLFTNNEEVGLIGASNLDLEIESKNILNLDGEDEEEIYIGCAGGIDIVSAMEFDYRNGDDTLSVYRVATEGLRGGHSGVDIDKDIPSAIKVLSRFLLFNNCNLISFEGGERRNSIPQKAVALVEAKELFSKDETIRVEKLDTKHPVIVQSEKILKLLNAFPHGVRGYDKDLGVPSVSINLAKVSTYNNKLNIELSARAMNDEYMEIIAKETKSFFELAGMEVEFGGSHPAWKPNAGEFAYFVKNIMAKYLKNVDFKAIHAGLECGVLLDRQKSKKEALSIGPNIRFPHSLKEECELDSVKRIASIVEEIVSNS